MSTIKTPTCESLKSILTRLFDIEVDVSLGDPCSVNRTYIANYAGTDNITAAISCSDPGMVVFAGAAFLQIPASDARDMLTSGEIRGDVVESYREVANVLTRVLSDGSSKPLHLENLLAPESVSAPVSVLVESANSNSFYVDVRGYGTGALTFYGLS